MKSKLKNLPEKPGIYLFYNSKKELIYIGKATSLKNRVRSYFIPRTPQWRGTRNLSEKLTSEESLSSVNKIVSGKKDSSPLTPFGFGMNLRPIEQMIHEVCNIKTIQTDSVLEAIIMEANNIKKFQPKYNVDLKDDKSWNYICITKDKYPKVMTIREHQIRNWKLPSSRAQAEGEIGNWKFVFGPYPGLKTKEMMNLLRKLFYISTCKPCEPGRPCKPCLYHQMGKCLGVCTGEISSTEYKKKVIRPLVNFLRGNKKAIIKDFIKKMKAESKAENFEEATRLRNQIKALERIHDIALLNKSFVEDKRPRTYDLGLKTFRIEGYDISNLGDTGMVGSMVVFENGESNKSEYRKFKIKSVQGQSDVDCLAEVMERRLKHAEWKLPDIILVDGGVPQVNAVCKVLKFKSYKVPVVGIAKGPDRKKNEFIIRSNEMIRQSAENFVKFVNQNQNLLIQVRDEAHRFAITYQRSLRKIKH